MAHDQPAIPSGFFGKLFDTSFRSFITPSIIQLLYILFIIGAGLAALIFVLAGFAGDTATGVVFLIVAPIVFLLYVILARVYLEIVVVLFRIADNTAAAARELGRREP